MDSSVSIIVANLFMEEFEEIIIIAENASNVWKIYADGTFIIQRTEHKDRSLHQIKAIYPSIKLTVEDTRSGGSCCSWTY